MFSFHHRGVRLYIMFVILALIGFGTARAVNIKRLQYGQQNRYHVTLCAKGDFKAAEDYARNYLNEHLNDLEAYYIQAMAQANLGKLDAAVKTIEESLDKGLPFDRYLAGPRDLFAPLYEHEGFRKLAAEKNVKLIHGPVLGAVTDTSARFWVRTVDESEVIVLCYSRSIRNMREVVIREAAEATARSKASDDYTAVVEVTDLTPDTEYEYYLSVDGEPIAISPPPRFRTAPATGESCQFEVGFGGGAGFIPWNERMWTTLQSRNLSAMLLLGDNVYIDQPEVPQTQRYCYYRRQSHPPYRRFAAGTPIYAVWDDHDFGKNDCTSALPLDEPAWKMDVLKVFTENFVNPAYGLDAMRPGCFHRFAIGDVDFILLDCRFYRQNPHEIKNPTMLGPDQKRWLMEQLKQSKATFKVVASSVPWASGTKPGSKDTWDGFPEEREEIFSFIADQKIEGVVLISADRHRSDAWRIQRPGAYDLFDFSSSKLTNAMSHPVMEGCLFGYSELPSAGLLRFDTSAEDPAVTYRIMNIDGEIMHSLTLRKSQLSFK